MTRQLLTWRWQPRKTAPFLLLIIGLLGAVWVVAILEQTAVAQSCTTIFTATGGWRIDICPTDPNITTPMVVRLNGVVQGDAALVRFSYPSQEDPGQPQVAVIYAAGYVRLKQNADPMPSIPFGTSFVLGPAYWSDNVTYHHNPQLVELALDTRWLPDAPLRMTAVGTNADFDVQYELTLPTPRDRQTRLHVTQAYTATTAVSIDPIRFGENQGLKLIQFSSMFINEGSSCDGGHTDCHDANVVRFIGDDLQRHEGEMTAVTPSNFLFPSTTPLGNTWIDLLHTDDTSWQGNTPNTRIVLDELPEATTITPQGWISDTTNPTEDNVGVWLHDDDPAAQTWSVGENGTVSYWLLSQDNPPEPWADAGLRSGQTILDFEGSYDCRFVKEAGQATGGVVEAIAGYQDTAVQLTYDLGIDDNNWTQIRCDFDPPLDLSATDHFRFDWRGDAQATNSLTVGFVNPVVDGENYFAHTYDHATHHNWWGQMVVPFDMLTPWTPGTHLDHTQVSAVFFSVIKVPGGDVGGNGHIAFDNLSVMNVASRVVPAGFEQVTGHLTVTVTAVNWLATQQTPSGLLESWEEESTCLSHTYDQALALILFAQQGRWSAADAVVTALAAIQNDDGSWFQTHQCDVAPPVNTTNNKWEGDIAWAIYALDRYLALGGIHPQAEIIRNRAAGWLATRINPADGCLFIDHTEGTLDAWWAMQSLWPAYAEEANGLKTCLLTEYWDESMGRFQGGRDAWHPFLDNQTWGAAFLKTAGEEKKALYALSYAQDTLLTPAQGGQGYGFDGQAGPWAVWNEGSAQYIAVGGAGANDLLPELLAQQRSDGAMPGSVDAFLGGGVWTTRWHGVAPTAWLVFALNSGPFHPGHESQYLPLVTR